MILCYNWIMDPYIWSTDLYIWENLALTPTLNLNIITIEMQGPSNVQQTLNLQKRNKHTVLTVRCTVRTQKVLKALMSTAAGVWINVKERCCACSCGYASISPDRARNSRYPPTLICFRGINAESHGQWPEQFELNMTHQQFAACALCSSVHSLTLAFSSQIW